MIERTVIGAAVMGLVGFGLSYGLLQASWSEASARNALLLLMVLFENIHIGNCRSETKSALRLSPLRTPIGAIVAFLVHVGAMHLPPGPDGTADRAGGFRLAHELLGVAGGKLRRQPDGLIFLYKANRMFGGGLVTADRGDRRTEHLLMVLQPANAQLVDLAVRGFKMQRRGLNQVSGLLDKKAVQVLLIFATNRVHRKMYRAVQFVEENVVSCGIRCIFANGIDTADEEHWRWLLHNYSMVVEFVVTMYANNVRAAHEGLLHRHLVYGTISFGYRGEPISGERTKRGKPRCKLIIDEEAAGWEELFPYVL